MSDRSQLFQQVVADIASPEDLEAVLDRLGRLISEWLEDIESKRTD